MTSERLQHIQNVFDSARDREPARRAAFLAEACRGDEELRREVESLLAQNDREGGFLSAPPLWAGERPAIEVAANWLANSTAPRMAAGVQLGPYKSEAQIGAGGMGEVWRARDTRWGRVVAIKILHQRYSQRFKQEARAITALNHPNICQIYDTGPDYLVLEYVDGKPPKGPLSAQETLRLALQIASALEEAHARGILHRDLKPSNILVTAKGTAKLLDFGLAKIARGPDDDVTKTLEGTVVGTAAYMAPEQAQGKPLDHRSDIFSFGAVLYEMVSGERAFRGDSMVGVLSAVVRDDPQPLACSPEIAHLVTRCLRKAPSERFQTMAEVRAALEAISEKPRDQPSVAVLPFANLTRDADDEYFSDGLAEEIINLLARIPGLNVTARTSSFAFRGKEQDITGIAEALRVRTVLEGSVRRSGSRIRVTVQLINAKDGYHLWSERYDREMTDVFAMQDEMAAAVAGALQVKLTGKPAAMRAHQPDFSAYDTALKGFYQLRKISPEGLARAEEYFKQAIALDPQWAQPHCGLGVLHMLLGSFGLRPLTQMVAQARAEAEKALELSPGDPNAHRVLGDIAGPHDYDWRGAEEHFRLARASEPIPSHIRISYARAYLAPQGRFEEAFEEMAKAIAQDPLNAVLRGVRAGIFFWAGMYERSIIEAREAMELGERSHLPLITMANCYFYQSRFEEARQAAEEAFRLAPWDPVPVGFLARLLMDAGEKDRAKELLVNLSKMFPAGMVTYHLCGSEIDAALDWYEKAIEQHQPFAAWWASSAQLRPLRASPRWPKLAKMMNFTESFAG
jgi:eukaryotic-like serine/threonine-protein kinase